MNDPIEPLILDFVEWIAVRPRPYAEVMESWRTSCPRLPVWEESIDRGYVERKSEPGRTPTVEVTTGGLALLKASNRNSLAKN
jgi:hypothetical protein